MRKLVRTLTLPILVLVLASCGGTAAPAAGGPRRSRDVITQEEMRAAGYTTAYQAVETLRSNWLRPRGVDTFQGSGGQVQVYMNDTRLGGVENLRAIGVQDVQYIRWYDGISASGRWGLDHAHGVIYVSSRPQ